ncbi:DNA-binding protein [Halospeciosus flavus]|uniref:DNA-binding protein n=1 Tax=Halospeciosus flavus TaxID=3032283 RepID=UPI003606283B
MERFGAFEVVDEAAERERNLRPTVQMEIAAKVDLNHPDGRYAGLTLEAEERAKAREWEIERTHERFDRRQDSDREARCRDYVAARTPSELWQVEQVDPRAGMAQAELAQVNQQADRLHGRVRGWTRGALSKQIARRVQRGKDVTDAVIETAEEAQFGAGQVVPIGALAQVEGDEVTVQGRVVKLWPPSHPSIAQVGLLEDETGTVRITVWEKSNKTRVREGERVRIGAGALSFYKERASIAITGWSEFRVLDRGRWWER